MGVAQPFFEKNSKKSSKLSNKAIYVRMELNIYVRMELNIYVRMELKVLVIQEVILWRHSLPLQLN